MAIQSAGLSRASFGYLPEGVAATIGEGQSALAALRQWRGLSCSQLSERSGVDLIIIMLAERGSDLMPEEKEAIARVLSVDPDMMGV
ncbi:hypothetical protein [Kaistia adipata]|uniref:hypothetical protein n=1 Tax=Kaistia adipata TaxID=166954 RepID=UPI0012EB7C86|nr:hypothetical protein [Kaistia adipata]